MNYLQLLQIKEKNLKRREGVSLKMRSQDLKPFFLKCLQVNFPVFFSLHENLLQNSPLVWWDTNRLTLETEFSEDAQKLPGILLWNHFFIGASFDQEFPCFYIVAWLDSRNIALEKGTITMYESPSDKISLDLEFILLRLLKEVYSTTKLLLPTTSTFPTNLPDWIES